MNDMQELRCQLIADIEKYKKNKESLTEEERQTKYKKAFDALRGRIKSNLETVAMMMLVSEVYATEDKVPTIQEIVNKCAKQIASDVFKECSFEKAEKDILSAREEIYENLA